MSQGQRVTAMSNETLYKSSFLLNKFAGSGEIDEGEAVRVPARRTPIHRYDSAFMIEREMEFYRGEARRRLRAKGLPIPPYLKPRKIKHTFVDEDGVGTGDVFDATFKYVDGHVPGQVRGEYYGQDVRKEGEIPVKNKDQGNRWLSAVARDYLSDAPKSEPVWLERDRQKKEEHLKSKQYALFASLGICMIAAVAIGYVMVLTISAVHSSSF